MAERPTVPETQARAAAAEMLGRVKSARTELQLALSRAIGSSAEPQLAEIIAHLAGAETELTEALDTPGASRRMPDLTGIARLLRARARPQPPQPSRRPLGRPPRGEWPAARADLATKWSRGNRKPFLCRVPMLRLEFGVFGSLVGLA